MRVALSRLPSTVHSEVLHVREDKLPIRLRLLRVTGLTRQSAQRSREEPEGLVELTCVDAVKVRFVNRCPVDLAREDTLDGFSPARVCHGALETVTEGLKVREFLALRVSQLQEPGVDRSHSNPILRGLGKLLDSRVPEMSRERVLGSEGQALPSTTHDILPMLSLFVPTVSGSHGTTWQWLRASRYCKGISS